MKIQRMSAFIKRMLLSFGQENCAICHTNPAEQNGICRECMAAICRETVEKCPDCGEDMLFCRCFDWTLSPVPVRLHNGERTRTWIVHGWYHPLYEAEKPTAVSISSILLQCKTKYSPALLAWMADIMAAELSPYLPKEQRKNWLLTWIPRSQDGYGRYGFDQSQEIAKRLGQKLGIPVKQLLRRVGGEEQKTMTDSAKRADNIAGAFAAEQVVPGCRVLLFDDIVTTGVTMREAAQVLALAGAVGVVPVVFARTLSKKRYRKRQQL